MTMTDTIAQRPATGGPFETEAQAHEYARSVVGLLAHTPIVSANRHVLMTTIEAAGITLGAYDRRIVDWLADWEPATCTVIAGLITRAHAGRVDGPSRAQQATVLAALADAVAYRTAGADARCEDCMAHPAGCCDRHADDLDQADRYRQLVRELGGQR
jgi:hypothetical protein